MAAPYGLTESSEFVANYVYLKIKNGITSLFVPGLQVAGTDVWYGDHALLPRTPAITVMRAPERSVYNGVGGRPVLITFQTIVMLYFGKVQDQQLNVHAGGAFANALKDLIHADATLGGNVIDCLCTAIDPGIAFRGGALMDANRLTFQSRSKVALNP